MTDENQKPAKKPKQKRLAIEPGIYPNLDKNGNLDGTFDVKVSRRMWMSDSNPHGQMFRRKRRVYGVVAAQRLKKKFFDELAMEALKHEGNDTTWEKAMEEYYKFLDRKYKAGFITAKTKDTTEKTLAKHTTAWNKKWLSEFTADFLETFLTDENLVSSTEATTRQTILKYIRGVFKRQIAIGKLKHNPASGIIIRAKTQPEDPVSMTHDEITKLIKYVEPIDPEWAEVYKVAYLTGARSGELYALKWEHIDFQNMNVHIKKSYDWKTEDDNRPTKGKKGRVVDINKDLLKVLMELRGKYDPYVLPRIQDWKNGKAAQKIRLYQTALKIQPSKFHAIRGSFITNLLLKGEAVVVVMQMAGHLDIKTTMAYVRKIGLEVKGATKSLTLEPNVVSMDEFKDKKKTP